MGEEIKQRVICKANVYDVVGAKKEENRGFPMSQQSGGLVKKWVRYEENQKVKISENSEN